MTDLVGRKLNIEKILFRKNTVLAGEDADWGRDAVRENVISAVSPLQCHVLCVPVSHSHVHVIPFPVSGSTQELGCGGDETRPEQSHGLHQHDEEGCPAYGY